MKLFWISLKYYSQTCSNYPLCKKTTHLRQPMLQKTIDRKKKNQIPVQSLLCKTTFLGPKWKKRLSKTTTKNFIQQRNSKKT